MDQLLNIRNSILSVGLNKFSSLELEIRIPSKYLDYHKCIVLAKQCSSISTYEVKSKYNKRTFTTLRQIGEIYESKETIFKTIVDKFIYSLAIEKKISSHIELKNTTIRRYTRYSKLLLSNTVRLDMSFINEQNWEVELELLDSFTHEHIEPFKKLLDSIYLKLSSEKSIIIDPQIKHILDNYPKPHDMYVYNIDIFPTYITGKVDGIRGFIISWDKKIEIMKLGENQSFITPSSEIDNYVIDCEIFNNIIFPIDIVYHCKIPIENKTYPQRRKILHSMFPDVVHINLWSITLKPTYYLNSYDSLIENIPKIEKIYSKYDIPIDGFIFYPESHTYLQPSYKWKYLPTIDVEYYSEYIYSNNERLQKVGNYKHHILEVYLENNTYKVLKERYDKDKPNSYKVIKTYINNYKKNLILTRDGLLCNNSQVLRYFHNLIKKQILLQLNGILLDIGSGIGGDLNKWSHFKHIISLEPNKQRHNIMKRRTLKGTSNITYITEELSKLKFIEADNVTMFFSLNQIGIKDFKSFLKLSYPNIHIIYLDCNLLTENIILPCAQIYRSSNSTVTTITDSTIEKLEEQLITLESTIDNYKLIKTSTLDEFYNMPRDIKLISSKYRYSHYSLK
jgi:hypothetical protein